MTATTDATGAYAFDIRAEHPAAYGVTADGAVALTALNLAKLKVAPAVTAKAQARPAPSVRGRRPLSASDHEPGVALPSRGRTCRGRARKRGHVPLPCSGAEARQVRGPRRARRAHGVREGQERGPEHPAALRRDTGFGPHPDRRKPSSQRSVACTLSEQRLARSNRLDPERRNVARRLVGGSLRSYGTMALLAAAAWLDHREGTLAIVLAVVGLVLVGLSFRINSRSRDWARQQN